MKSLGEKINDMLIIRDKKAVELANESGVSKSIISELISGKRSGASTETLKKLSKVLGVNVAYFIEDDVIGPAEILQHLSDEEKAFVIDENNVPFIKLSREAAKNGVTPKQLEYLIKAILENS